MKLAQVHDPQAHGDAVAWVVTKIDIDDDTYTSAIWVANSDGSNARQLTSGTWKDSNPRWSPDGTRIAFTSNRPPAIPAEKADQDEAEESNEEKPRKKDKEKKPDTPAKHPNQLWVIRLDGGEAQQVTNRPYGTSSGSWNGEGTHLTFSAQSEIGDDTAPMTIGDVADELIVRDLSYRFDGIGYRERYSHIWKVDVEANEQTQLTNGEVFESDPQWQPNGSLIAFSGNRRDDRKRYLNPRQLLVVDADGGEVSTIGGDDVSFGAPSWSPDGSRIAWLGHDDASANTRNANLWTANADGSNVTNHSQDWDTSVGDYGMSDVHGSSEGRPIWKSGNEVLALASQRGSTHVFSFQVNGDPQTPQAITSGNSRIGGFAITDSGIVYVAGKINRPKELFASDANGQDETQISHANDEVLASLVLENAIDITATAPDGWEIQAWLLPPANREEGKKYPAIVQIHGGPHAMYAYDFFHEMQAMSAKGYAVIFSNPRGSAGYGEHFNACTRANWGEADMPDVIASLEAAIESVDWIDTDRLGVTGGSYGGYLTNWIVGHDDRFKAAVTQRCVSNFHSFFGTSDIGVNFGEFEFGGVPWKDAELLLKHSPISYVDQITTPLLIVHNENDLRCPIEQSEQMFTALKYLEREVGFVRIPGESHDLSRSGTPSRRKARLSHIIGWFDTHL